MSCCKQRISFILLLLFFTMTCLSELLFLLFITPLATQNVRTLKLSHLNNTLYTCSDPQCSPSILITVSNVRHCQIACLATTECRTVVFYQSNNQCQLFVDIATYMGTLSIQMGAETMIAIDNRKLSARKFCEKMSISTVKLFFIATTSTTTSEMIFIFYFNKNCCDSFSNYTEPISV